jgi:hypothetical protein
MKLCPVLVLGWADRPNPHFPNSSLTSNSLVRSSAEEPGDRQRYFWRLQVYESIAWYPIQAIIVSCNSG